MYFFLIQCICPLICALFKNKNYSIYYNCLYPCFPTHTHTQSYKYPFIFTFFSDTSYRGNAKNHLRTFYKQKCLGFTFQTHLYHQSKASNQIRNKTIKLLLLEYSLYWLSDWIKDQTIKCLRALDRLPSIFPRSRLSSIIDLIAEAKIQALCTTHCLHPSLHTPTSFPQSCSILYVHFAVQAVMSPSTRLLYSWRLASCQTHNICSTNISWESE